MRLQLLFAALLVGCAANTSRVCPAPPRTANAANPPRTQCLAPPYAPPPAGAGGSGWSSRKCGERTFLLVRNGHRTFEAEEFERASGGALRALANVSSIRAANVGPCCVPERGAREDATCLHVRVGLCTATISQLAATIQDATALAFAEDTHLPITVELEGRVGPRCDPSREACGAQPFEGSNAISTCGTRVAVGASLGTRFANLSEGTCAHDGECVIDGCSNHCVAWPLANNRRTCESYAELSDRSSFCGCVRGRCSWFFEE